MGHVVEVGESIPAHGFRIKQAGRCDVGIFVFADNKFTLVWQLAEINDIFFGTSVLFCADNYEVVKVETFAPPVPFLLGFLNGMIVEKMYLNVFSVKKEMAYNAILPPPPLFGRKDGCKRLQENFLRHVDS